MAWDEMKFNAALASKLKNQDIHAQVEGFNANTNRINAATQADLLPSQQATHLAAAQAGLMNAGSNRMQIASANPMGFSDTQVGSMGLRGLGVRPTQQATQYGLQMYGGPGQTNPMADIAMDTQRRYGAGSGIIEGQAAARRATDAANPGPGMPTATTYADIQRQRGFMRGGPMGDVRKDNGQDTHEALVREGEYLVDPTAVRKAFSSDGNDYHEGVRNLNRIIHNATGYEPGATYAKKGKAGFARSGGLPGARRPVLGPFDGLPDENPRDLIMKRGMPGYKEGGEVKGKKKKVAAPVPVPPPQLVEQGPPGPRRAPPVADVDWNEMARTGWTPGMPPAQPVTDAQWNATQRGGREPLRSGTPPGPAIEQWNAMAGGVRGYPKQPGEDWAETTFGRTPTAAVPQTPRGQHYQSALPAAPAVPMMSSVEDIMAKLAPPSNVPTAPVSVDPSQYDPNLSTGIDPGVAAAVQRTADAPRTPAATAVAAAAPTGVRKQYDMSEDVGVSHRAGPMPKGYANFDEGTTPWAVRNKIQAGGQPGEQVTLNYGPGYEKPGDKIYAQANAAGRFDSFSDRPQAPVPGPVQKTSRETNPYLRAAHGGVVPGRGLRMAKGGVVPGFINSGTFTENAFSAEEVAAQQAAEARAAAIAAENARNAQAAAAALRTGPTTGAIPTGMNAPPPGGPPPPLSPWRAAISGGNTTPVSQALGQTARAGINAVKAVGPAAGTVLRTGGQGVLGEGLRQGLVGAWTTPIADYAKRGGFELGEEGTVGGELKNIGIRAAGVGSDIGRGTLNALALPANLLQHGLDTKKWYDYGEENFADVKDKMWEQRHWDELMARKTKLEGGGGTPSTPSRDQLIAALQQRGKDWYANEQRQAAGGAGGGGAARPSLRDVILTRAMALGGGGTGAMNEQHNLLGYLAGTEQKQTDPATAALAAAKFNAEHEREIEASLLPRFKKTVTDDKGNEKEVDDREKFSRFVADVSGQGYNLYQMSRKDRDHLIDEWSSRDFTEGNVRKLAAASGDPNVALSQRLQPGRLRQGLTLSDVVDSPNINMWDYIKSLPGSGVRNQVYEQPSVDASTGKPSLQLFPGTVFENPNGTLNYDAWRYANQPKK